MNRYKLIRMQLETAGTPADTGAAGTAPATEPAGNGPAQEPVGKPAPATPPASQDNEPKIIRREPLRLLNPQETINTLYSGEPKRQALNRPPAPLGPTRTAARKPATDKTPHRTRTRT